MNKATRVKLAAQIADIATTNGATVTVEHDGRWTYIGCHYPGAVSVGIDLDHLLDGGILANWYGAQRNLAPGPFDSINPVHRRKATQYGRDAESFLAKFERACRAVANGEAFT